MEPNVDRQVIDPDQARRLAYESLCGTAAVEEQERWSSLYNYLMASTILLLAWATVFGCNTSARRTLVLSLLAGAGIVISSVWVLFGARINTFVEAYRRAGEAQEERLGLAELGPFSVAAGVRKQEQAGSPAGVLRWLGSVIRARYFYVCIPALFVVVYSSLLLIALWP